LKSSTPRGGGSELDQRVEGLHSPTEGKGGKLDDEEKKAADERVALRFQSEISRRINATGTRGGKNF